MPTMPEATGTLAQQIELVSDTPTDIHVINMRFAVAVKGIEIIAKNLAEKLAKTSDPAEVEKLEEDAARVMEGLNLEMKCRVEAKRRWEARRH